jgi:hypothetical protein
MDTSDAPNRIARYVFRVEFPIELRVSAAGTFQPTEST